MEPTIRPGSIAVAVDGSRHAERALRWAADQAALEGRRLLVVHVAAPPARTGWLDDSGVRWAVDPSSPEAARAVPDHAVAAARQLHPGLDVAALPLAGDPRAALLDLSTRLHLLVLGSRGRGSLRSKLLGSVSAAVSKHAHCPVVICRPEESATPGRGVLVAADGTRDSVAVIEFAFAHASARSLPLTVLHCFWDVVAAVANYRALSGADLPAPDLQELHLVLSESLAGMREKYPDVPVSVLLEHGLVDEGITRRGRHWDLIVVGRHPVDSLARVLVGSIATTVVERARTTVAVVPEATSEREVE